MIINDSDLFYTCSLLELIGRVTRQKRGAVVDILGKKVVAHIYASAETLICEPIAHTADEFIEMYRVPQGEFDNLASCKYEIPDYGTIGKVYARLIEDVAREDLIDSLFQVYASEVSDMISDYNTDFYNQSRDYIKEYYITNGDPDGIDLRIPDIRFKGFTGEWERRKLREILVQRIEHQTITADEPLLAFSYAEGVIDPEDKKSNKRDFIMTDKYNKIFSRTEIDDIIYNPANVIRGAIHRNALKKGVVSPIYKIFKCEEGVSPKYMGELLHTDSFISEITKYIEGTVIKLRTLSPETFLEMEIEIPESIIEQEIIGAFLDSLDALIALHERKCERLQNVKKSMLEKMFPKKGSNVPEIRFAGFTEPWEMRKIGELASVSMNRRIFKEQTTETGDVPFFKIGTFGSKPDAYITRELFNEYRAKYPYPNVGDILISASGSIGRTVEYSGKDEYFQDSNIVWLTHDQRIDNSFLKCFYVVVRWAGIEGSTIKRLYNDNILNTYMTLPSVAEQRKIGLYFRNLDNLITLHQRELEKLKNIKKSMLEKMFV